MSILALTLSTGTHTALVAAAATGLTSSYSPISPVRVLDTRELGASSLPVGADLTIDPLTAPVLAAAGAERAEVVAVVVNATLTDVANPGFLTLYPADADRPEASNLNVEHAGQTLANAATVPVGADGRIRAFSSTGGHLILDVQGVYVSGASAASGRLVMLGSPVRALDTRRLNNPLAPGTERVISLFAAGVPATASAAILNVTVTESFGAGYTTVYPSNEPRPKASNVNVGVAGQTTANQVVAKVFDGQITVFSMAGSHLIVDVAGYYTGAFDAVSSEGMFVPFTPRRLLDTRRSGLVAAGGSVTVNAAAVDAVPADALAVVTNLTITESGGPGFVTAYPANTPLPKTSSINTDHAGQTVANHAVIAHTTNAGFTLFTSNGTHLVLDASGYFTASSTTPPPVVPPQSATYPTGDAPSGIVFDGTSLWISNFSSDTVSKMNPATGARTDYPVGDRPYAIAFDGTSIWVSHFDRITKMNPATGSRNVYLTNGGANAVLYDGTSIWVACSQANTVTKMDRATGTRTEIPSGRQPFGLAYDGTSIWITNVGDNTVSEMNPATGAKTDFPTGSGPQGVAHDGTNIWVANNNSDTISKINPATGTKTDYPTADGPTAVIYDGTSIWVSNVFADSVSKFNPVTGTRTDYATGDGPQALAFDGTSIWVPNTFDDTVSKFNTG